MRVRLRRQPQARPDERGRLRPSGTVAPRRWARLAAAAGAALAVLAAWQVPGLAAAADPAPPTAAAPTVAAAAPADPGGVRALRRGTAHDALYDIAFDGARGVAVGAFGTVLTSADGGASWRQEALPVRNLALLSVAIRGGHCIAVGQNGSVFTADDCKGWKAAAPVTKSRLLSVAVNAQGVAWAVGAFGTILRSADWGKTWDPQTVDWKGFTDDGAEPHLYAVHVADDGTPTVVGEFELILRAAASGGGWKALHKGERSLFGITVLDGGRAYAVGQSGGVLASADGGASWRSLSTGTSAILTGVYAQPNGLLVVGGINTLLVSKDEGANWARPSSKAVASGWHQALAAGARTDGKPRLLAVGSGGAILELDL